MVFFIKTTSKRQNGRNRQIPNLSDPWGRFWETQTKATSCSYLGFSLPLFSLVRRDLFKKVFQQERQTALDREAERLLKAFAERQQALLRGQGPRCRKVFLSFQGDNF